MISLLKRKNTHLLLLSDYGEVRREREYVSLRFHSEFKFNVAETDPTGMVIGM